MSGFALAFLACGDSDDPADPGCLSEAECDDGNPCTVASCVSGGCLSSAVADGPLAEQSPGDCARNECVSGIMVAEYDPTDTLDDGNDCTVDQCTEDGPESVPAPTATACEDDDGNAGTCELGVCTVT